MKRVNVMSDWERHDNCSCVFVVGKRKKECLWCVYSRVKEDRIIEKKLGLRD